MKRSKTSTKAMRQRKTKSVKSGSSHYALKVRRGNQMYGPGCCAHRLIKRAA